MSIFRTIAMFIYLFGYMIVHYGVLRRAERALAAGDMQLVEELGRACQQAYPALEPGHFKGDRRFPERGGP